MAAPLSRGIANDAASPIEQESHEAQALILAKQLRASFELFYRSGLSGEVDVDQALPRVPNSNSEMPAPVLASPFGAMTAAASAASDLETRLTLEVGCCRSLRRPIGLAAIEAQSTELLDSTQTEVLERLMTRACNRAEGVTTIEQLGPRRRLLLFPGRDRHEAVAAARHVVDEIRSSLEPYCRSEQLPAVAVGAGVACAAAPAKNFRPVSLLETADRCLTAALRSGGVKSLEVS